MRMHIACISLSSSKVSKKKSMKYYSNIDRNRVNCRQISVTTGQKKSGFLVGLMVNIVLLKRHHILFSIFVKCTQ